MTTDEQVKEAAETHRKAKAFEFGLEAGLADLGIDKQAYQELLGVDADGLVELHLVRAQECSQQANPNQA